ncbi:glycosyltransferase [Levilactobacillus andaensis]|uniref:glycosyltransferase n=1 Tax=Levilactobacillus andaensis TaxID=2799570 RepID=UPI0019454CEF|nr:glycosyltransferase [Levilactobacillus andaensis]
MKKIEVDISAQNLSGRGGTETVVSYVLNNAFIGEHCTFNVLLTGKYSDASWFSESSNLRNYRIVKNSSKIVKLLKSAMFYFKSDADVILVLGTGQILIATLIKKIFKKKYKVVSWMHFSIFDANFINTKYLVMADYHLAISSEIKNQLIELKVPADRIEVIYNPVAKQNNQVMRKTSGVVELVYIGRVQLDEQKNMREMLVGLSKYLADWHLSVFGSGETERLQVLAQQLNISSRISIYGWRSDPWSYIESADVLLLTSRFEGFGMVLAEAISRGLPCVSSDCPVGPSDIVKNGINGELYITGDCNDFLRALNVAVRNPNYKNIADSLNNLYEDNYIRRFVEGVENSINETV